jgi:HK97 gp10 family phage protein
MSTVTPNSGAVLAAAKVGMKTDLEAFGQVFANLAKEMAPPPPKFGPVPSTGHNARSIDHKVTDDELQVYTESGYGGWLEIGTSKMEARPYFRPAFEQTKEDFA